MAIVTTDDVHYTDIAAAIREKNGSQTQYLPAQMAAAIAALELSGGVTMTSGEVEANTTVFETGLTSVEVFLCFAKTYRSSYNKGRLKVGVYVASTGDNFGGSHDSNSTSGTLTPNGTAAFTVEGGTVTYLMNYGYKIVEPFRWFAFGTA